MGSTTIKGITVALGGDTTQLQKSFKDLDGKSRSLQKELTLVNKELKFDPKNSTLLAAKQEVLSEKVETARQKLKLLNDMQAEVEKQAKAGTLGADKYRQYQTEVESTKNILANLEKQLKTTGDEFAEVQRKSGAVTFKNAEDKVEHFKGKVKDMTKEALKDAEKLAKGFDKVGDGLEKAGSVLNKGSAAAAAVLAGSVASFKDLDEGYDVIVKKTGATDDKFESLKKTADELFSGSTFDMTDIGNALGEVNTRFGYTEDKLKSVTEQYLQFAKINDADVSDSISKTARIMQAWDISADNLPDLLGMITAKGQETGVAVGGLMDKVLDNNATFKEMGLSLEESITLMAQFERNGVNDSTALTAMKTAVKNAAKEGKPLSDVLRENVNDIKNASNETEALQKATELFGTKGAAEMANAIKEGRISFDDLSGSMSSYKDTVKKTYDATLDPLEESKQVINNLKLAGADLAATALKEGQPLIEDVIDGVKGVTNWLKKLTPEEKKTLTEAIKIVAVAGPAVTIGGKLTKGIGSIIGFLPKMVNMVQSTTVAQKGWNAALNANPIGAVILGVTALVTALAGLNAALDAYVDKEWSASESKKFADEVDKASETLKSSADEILETIDNTIEGMNKQVANNSLIDTYQEELDKLISKSELTTTEKSKLDTIVSYLTDNVDGFATAWDKYTIRDKDGNIKLVSDLDTVKAALDETIDKFQKAANIEILQKTYNDELSKNFEAITKRDASKAALEREEQQLNKRLEELGISKDQFEKVKKGFGTNPIFMQDITTRLGGKATWGEYNELVKLSDSIAEYTDNVQRLNEALNKSDELRADAVDVMNVLNGNYNDSAAVLMAYKLNMISLEDVEKTRWGNLRALEIAAADTHKNTIFGELGENESFHKKIEESQDQFTKNLIDNLAVNQETLKSNTSSVRENTDELNKNIYSGQESLEQSLINRLAINKNTTKESVESTTKAIEDETPNLKKASEEASKSIEKSFEDVDLEEQGGNIILGLLKGFWNNSIFEKIGKAVGNVSQSIYNVFTSWWDMHSPAKKSGPLGKNIVLGIPPGMLSEKKAVEQAGEEINEALYSSLQADSHRIAEIRRSFNQNLADLGIYNAGNINLQNAFSSLSALKNSRLSDVVTRTINNSTTTTNKPVINVNVSGVTINNDSDIDALTDRIANQLGEKMIQDGRRWG